MLKLLRCRRGSVAIATVAALIPLIGAVALGGEAASWYVGKQDAQNAADAAAYSGALRLACNLTSSAGTCSSDTQSVDYRGKQFAAQNAYCNAGATSYPGSRCTTPRSGVTQSVAIDIGTFTAPSTWTSSVAGSFVRATVGQTQPAYLAALLGFSTINISATAIAQVKQVAQPCVLALTGSIAFQGSPNINAPNCGVASNDPAANALDFTGGGMTMNVGSLSAAGGCTGTATFCAKALTYSPPVTNPFAALDAVTLPTMPVCSSTGTGSLTPYSAATPCRNDNVSMTGNTTYTPAGGVYFISGTLTLKGTTCIGVGAGCTSPATALFILLPGATFDMKGTGTINIKANASVTSSQVPAALAPYVQPACTATSTPTAGTCLLNNMALYDQSSAAVSIGGTSNINFAGDMYAPNAPVTFQGNPTVSACGELVAASIKFAGNATFDNSRCSAFKVPTPVTQIVALVQ